MVIIILCFLSPSPKQRHDLHCHRLDTLISTEASLSSYQILLLWLSLPLSDKVKQLHGDCISYNKATTIRFLPVADNFYKTWSSHTTIYISSRLDHITSQHALQNKLDVLYFVVASFTWLLRASSKNHSYLRIKTTTIFHQVCCFNLQQGPAVVKLNSTKVGETDTCHPPLCNTHWYNQSHERGHVMSVWGASSNNTAESK